MNLIHSFLETAERNPEKTAIITGAGEAITFGALADLSARLAAGWRKAGIGPGDRVLLAMSVDINLYGAIAGLWRIGATIVFPEPAMGLNGLAHGIAMTKPKAILATGPYRLLRYALPPFWRIPLTLHWPDNADDGADPLTDVANGHPALISFTSGSTGKPKGLCRSHGFLAAQNACVGELLAPQRDDERDLVAFPVFVIANLGQGVTSVLPNWKLTRHDLATAKGIATLTTQHGITRMLAPPSICETIASGPIQPALDAIFTGGGPVFPDLLQRLGQKMPATTITSVYGSTEAEPIAHQRMDEISEAQWADMMAGKGLLAGKPMHKIKLVLLDEEIVVTGDHVNKGYLNGRGDDANKVKLDGEIWHRTGDAGSLDVDGNLWLRGRLGAAAGGRYPFEIEVAARFWPGVEQVALTPGSAPPALIIQGAEPQPGDWQKRASKIGDLHVVKVKKIPLDKRHRSKIDYPRLQAIYRTEVAKSKRRGI